VAAKAQEAAAAQFEVDKTTMSAKHATDKYVGTLNTSRQAFIDGATAAGFNGDQVQALADKVLALPPAKEINLLVDTANATQQINEWVSIQNGKQIHIAVGVGGAGGITQADGGKVNFYANGGRENHIAQVVRAPTGSGLNRRRGGEYYNPHRPVEAAEVDRGPSGCRQRVRLRARSTGSTWLCRRRSVRELHGPVEQHFHLPPVPTDDPRAAMEVLGRAFARASGDNPHRPSCARDAVYGRRRPASRGHPVGGTQQRRSTMSKRISREVRTARNESLDATATSALDWYQKEVAELDALGLPAGEHEQRKTALFHGVWAPREEGGEPSEQNHRRYPVRAAGA
jgi:hypothetical protein